MTFLGSINAAACRTSEWNYQNKQYDCTLMINNDKKQNKDK